MFFRRQRTKWRTNSFLKKKIIVEIFEIQSKTKITILIKNVFEKRNFVEYDIDHRNLKFRCYFTRKECLTHL